MIRFFSCFILLVGFVFTFVVETKAQDTDTLVAKIRGHYAQINKKLKSYRKVKKAAEGFSLEGGEMTAYFSGKKIMKIAAIFYGESHRTTCDYYFHEGKLIFVFQKRFNYKEPLSGKVVSTEEDRFYFNDDSLIKWLDGNKDRDLNDEEANDMKTVMLDDTKKLIEIANS